MDCQIHFSCVRSDAEGAQDATGAAALVATLAAVASAAVTAAAAAAAKQKMRGSACSVQKVCYRYLLQINLHYQIVCL